MLGVVIDILSRYWVGFQLFLGLASWLSGLMRLPLNARRCCQYKLEVPGLIPHGGNSGEIQLMQPCEEETFILKYYYTFTPKKMVLWAGPHMLTYQNNVQLVNGIIGRTSDVNPGYQNTVKFVN